MRSTFRRSAWHEDAASPTSRRDAWLDLGAVTFAEFAGTPGDDRLTGTDAGDTFDMSQGGDDLVRTRGGNDVISYGAAFTGADRLNGGNGFDIVVLDGDYSAGIKFRESSLVGIENLVLEGGSYVLTGELGYRQGSSTVISGYALNRGESLTVDVRSAGNLLVYGGGGDDVLRGARNAVTSLLSGAGGDDVLIAGKGATTLRGGRGADRITMAHDGDIASYSDGRDSVAESYDTIKGFEASGGKLRLEFDSDTTKKGIQHDFHLGETPGRTGDITVAYDAGSGETIVRAFTDGDAVADFVLHLTGDVTLTAGDLLFG
jgi:hypothetical protein